MQHDILLPFSGGCLTGRFLERHRRFSVALGTDHGRVWIHSNNTGSMLGLTRPGALVLASKSPNPNRKLPYTQEAVRCGDPPGGGSGFWAGVNTSVPNRMIEAAFLASRLGFAKGYTAIRREVRLGESRLDALLTGPSLPPLWVECKNVTLVEDGMACFPDAATVRGQKHLRELMDIVSSGERGAMFYLVQRPDGRCFGPAAFIDPAYAALFWQALRAGVEIYPYEGCLTEAGIGLGRLLPLAKPDCPDVSADFPDMTDSRRI